MPVRMKSFQMKTKEIMKQITHFEQGKEKQKHNDDKIARKRHQIQIRR